MPTEVVENGVTITASASEAEIRESAGFTEATKAPDAYESGRPVHDSGEIPTQPEDDAANKETAAVSGDRNSDGTFKAKPKEGNPRKDPEARIGQATARQREAERRAEAAEARAQALEAQLAAGSTPKAPAVGDAPQPTATPKPPTHLELVKRYQADAEWPKLEQFVAEGFEDPYQACAAAQAAYITDKRLEERDARQQQSNADRDAHERLTQAYDDAAAKYPDWDTLMASEAAQVVLPAAVVNELYADPSLSADLMHLLLTNPDEVLRLSQVRDPLAAAREVAKLSTRLTAAPSGPAVSPPPQTRAKPLIKPVSASPAAPEAVPPEDLEFGPRYIAAMNAKERKAKEASRA